LRLERGFSPTDGRRDLGEAGIAETQNGHAHLGSTADDRSRDRAGEARGRYDEASEDVTGVYGRCEKAGPFGNEKAVTVALCAVGEGKDELLGKLALNGPGDNG